MCRYHIQTDPWVSCVIFATHAYTYCKCAKKIVFRSPGLPLDYPFVSLHTCRLCPTFISLTMLLVGRGEKRSNFAGFLGANSRKKRPISREFHGNFRGQFCWKTIGIERPISWELPEQISLESDWFCADVTKVFNETRRSYRFTQASYRNMKAY